KRISVISASGTRAAEAVDIDGECRLIVRYDDGETAALSSGEISIRL
ncbi:MAG: biotin--[acetyl-CoA-carboxylase] ligase, partial [Oscillospiraceae bacterium]|nr:biotin--[acetyl-CoA-carboxylase] ligase [Oscillospiraceae bacterium]